MAGACWFEPGLYFDCRRCGNCCSGPPGYVWLDDAEARQIAEFLGLSVTEFLRRYAEAHEGRWSLIEVPTEYGRDCIFLLREGQATACAIYSCRPRQCRTWPFWPENLASPQHWRRAGRRCPGIRAGLSGQGTFYPAEKIRGIRDSQPVL